MKWRYYIDFAQIWLGAMGAPWFLYIGEKPWPRRCRFCQKPEIDFPRVKQPPLIPQFEIVGNEPFMYYVCRNHGDYYDKRWITDCLTGCKVEIFSVHNGKIILDRWLSEILYWGTVIGRFLEHSIKYIVFFPLWLIHKLMHKIERWLFGE